MERENIEQQKIVSGDRGPGSSWIELIDLLPQKISFFKTNP